MVFFSKNFNKQSLFAIAIIVVLVFLMTQISALSIQVSKFSDTNSSMIREIGMVREASMSFGNDLNEVRKFLLLPTKEYFKFEEAEALDNADKNTDKLQLQLFKYIDFIGKREKIAENNKIYDKYLLDLKNSENFNEILDELGLVIKEFDLSDNASIIAIGNNEYDFLKYFLDKENSEFFYRTVFLKEEKYFDSFSEFEEFSIDFLKDNLERSFVKMARTKDFFDSINQSLENEEVLKFLNEKELKISISKKDDTKTIYLVEDIDLHRFAEIIVDEENLNITLQDLNNPSNKVLVNELNLSLLPFLKKLDLISRIQLEVINAKNKIEELISDKGFLLSLEENNLKISDTADEDDKRFYYKIYDKNGNHISSVVVEKATGVVNIVDPNGTNSENLLFFTPEDKKKTIDIPENIPEYSNNLSSESGKFNVLIAGKHGNLIDTMIFTHVDEISRKIKMISIPRDLFYNGRKINSFGFFYGMEELKKALSDMTGYKLDKYILIDMYAFIDVIDLIGGIDITLKNAVIDPTYRTVDNGVVGTLHYLPGDYHLGGKEALRLARTRHTSSDFARAERQQLILKALQNKAKNFGFGDADTFYKIARTVLSKTDTDIKLEEAIAYYFKYQSFEISSNNVMSSGNVLYVPPYTTIEQCRARIAQAEAEGNPIPNCMNENQAYTLMPRDNNWNIVKWFFRENFEEKTV